MRGKKLTEEKKDTARAMLIAGKSYRIVAEALEISVGTVYSIAKESSEAELEKMVNAIKKVNVARHLMLANFMLDELATHVNSQTRVRDIAIAAAILTDKALLLEKNEKRSRTSARNDNIRFDLSPAVN